MKDQERIFSTLENIIINSLAEIEVKEKETELKKSDEPQSYYDLNKKTYDDLVSISRTIYTTKSLNSEKVSSLKRLVNHLDELLAIKSNSNLLSDKDFCQAIYQLRNQTIEYKLSLERTTEFNLNSDLESEKEVSNSNNIEGFKDYNKPDYTRDQVLFFMNELRKLRFTISDLNDTKMAQGLHILTGYSPNTLRPNLGKIINGQIKLSEKDKNQLKEMLKHLSKAVDAI